VSEFHPSARTVLGDLRAKYPDAPFLALGQTVWWDEPMKAVLRRMLDEMGLGGSMILGVHDTDYFAKAHLPHNGESRFQLVPHNDGTTRDLWSAAGEISRLFGSETYPTRHDFNRYHVPFNLVARHYAKDRTDFLNEVTEAWGWRGLVYTGSRDLIVHKLPLADITPAVLEMLRWGFEGTHENMVDNCCREEARQLAARLLQSVADYYQARPDESLTDLYQDLFPKLFELLLGSPPNDVSLCCSAHMLRLTPETAALPRFRFVDLFLNEKTRALAADAYNQAVAGSEIYTLDRFGLGALPFDLVLPQHGRGTLRVTLRAIHVETRNPIRIPLRKPVNSVEQLAGVLQREFGDHVTLVGKAVALISMLASEFIFVFNEEGSSYVSRTRTMNDHLRAQGIDMHMHPILRLRYHTWDALEVGRSTLSLPDHLAAAFGQRQIPSCDFARQWKSAVAEQTDLLDQLESITSPRHLMRFMQGSRGEDWAGRLAEYDEAKSRLCTLRREGVEIQSQVESLYDDLHSVKEEIRVTERAKGDHFRSVVDWTPEEEARRAGFTQQIEQLLARRRETLTGIAGLKAKRLALERGPEASHARETLERIEAEAGMARLRLVQNAVLTRTSLTHTDHRPSAWWLPMVDPCGEWFQRIVETTEVYMEPVISG
jgi:hypothetical protein